MNRGCVLLLSLALASTGICQTASGLRESAVTYYTGSADASGAVACGTDFFAVCDDEDSVLRFYRRNGGGAPVAQVDLSAWSELQVPGAKREFDLEAAAQLGAHTFWIGSHGNSKEGKVTPNRRQLFATTVTHENGVFQIKLVGQPYRHLLDDLLAAPALRPFNLGEAAAKARAPKDEGGFNIEGLAATPEGHLLVGFRNPIPSGTALLVPVLNPLEIIRGKRARIGEPIRLELRGRGIRDIVLVAHEYFILAGDYRSGAGAKATTQLYRWSGPGTVPQWLTDFPHLNPEALIAFSDTAGRELQVLSDDGQKPPLPSAQRTFRSVQLRF